jgi:hypothetical protein
VIAAGQDTSGALFLVTSFERTKEVTKTQSDFHSKGYKKEFIKIKKF